MPRMQRMVATSRGEFERKLKAARKEFMRLEALCRSEFEKSQRKLKIRPRKS